MFNENWGISTDEYNFVLFKIRTTEKGANAGEIYYSTVGYYGTLEMAVKGFIKHSTRTESDKVKSLPDLMNKLEDIHQEVRGFLGKITISQVETKVKVKK